MEGKLQILEQSNLEIQLSKRELASKLEIANSTIEHLNSRNEALKTEIRDCEESKKKLNWEVEESREHISKHKTMYKQETLKSSRLESEINDTQSQFDQSQQVISKLNLYVKELEGKLDESSNKHQKYAKKMESQLEDQRKSEETLLKKLNSRITELEESNKKDVKKVNDSKDQAIKAKEKEIRSIVDDYESKLKELGREIEEGRYQSQGI